MGRVIQVGNVPDDVHRQLQQRAAAAGVSRSDDILDELRRMLTRSSNAEVLVRDGGANHDALLSGPDAGRGDR